VQEAAEKLDHKGEEMQMKAAHKQVGVVGATWPALIAAWCWTRRTAPGAALTYPLSLAPLTTTTTNLPGPGGSEGGHTRPEAGRAVKLACSCVPAWQ
jgi:hypothetical protein